MGSWLSRSAGWTSPLHYLEPTSIVTSERAASLLRAGADIGSASPPPGMDSPLSIALGLAKCSRLPDDSAAALVLKAARRWSPATHFLFPPGARARAVALLKLGYLLAWGPPFVAMEQSFLDACISKVLAYAVERV